MNTLLILALVAGAQSGPISQNTRETCATTCTASSKKFGYDAGHTYEFRYAADTVTRLSGASQQHSSLHITATANIEVLSACEHVLVLKDVSLEDSDPRNLATRQRAANHDEFRRALEKQPLRFSFQDGRVDRLCSHHEDPVWVTNVKRGVLSTYQNSMETLDKDHEVSETDVAGKCQAEYKISGSGWNSVTVKKTKNLLGCTDRQGGLSALQGTPYNMPSEIQSLPLLKSTHECEQKLRKGGHIESTTCEESHVFRPFSNEKSGASTSTTQKLEFVRKHAYITTTRGSFSKTSTMLFEHSPDETETARDVSKAEELIQTLCSSFDVRPSTPSHFRDLVYTLKRLNTAAMHSLHRRMHSDKFCDNAHKLFEDAIPMVGSAASVAFMKELMTKEKVDADRVAIWMSSLAFISRPDADMIRQARGLLDLKNQEQVLLPVSALVNTYCRHNPRCASEPDVGDIVRIIRENLGVSCRHTTSAEKRKMMKSMKAIGNIPVALSATDVLKQCYTDYKNPTDVRVAAIEAMRRMPCSVVREEMMEILTDADLDAELRIAAYLGLMQCPTKQLITQIKTMLEKEEVNQVGSFIWTHFTNLQTTGDIFKADIAAILKDQKLAKEFDMDKRKFSRNYEKSFFLHSFNLGGKAEGNLIWSQKSFIPRSANLNLTMDVFGHSLNLLEFGGRVEGLDRMLENFFGPDGYFKKGPKKESREKRSVSGLGQLERLHKKYALKPEDDLQGSAYFRMFGNDLAYMDIKDLKPKKGEEFNILEFLIKLAQDHKVDMSRSYMFLDATLTVPTAAGLPLKLAVNGTATVRLQVQGKLDLRKLGTTPRSLDIDGSIKPSGAVEISSLMSVDAFHARTGLQMVTSLHSSTGLDGKLKIQDSQIVTAQLNWPKDKIEIFNVESKFFVLHRERPVEQEVVPGRLLDRKLCTGQKLQKTLGLQLCGELKVAKAASDSPLFPLTGPASASITLQKTDTHSSYQFDARMLAVKDRRTKSKTYQARVAFNTPGSRVDRELLTEFLLNTKDKDVKFEIRSPWKKVALAGSLTYTDEIKRVKARVMLDSNQEIALLTELKTERSPRKMTVTPVLQIKAPWISPWTISGKAEAVYGKEYSAELNAEILNKQGAFKGSVEIGRNGRYDTSMQLKTPVGSAKMSGFLEKRRISSRGRLVLSYNLLTDTTHRITFSGKGKAISKGLAAKYQGSMALQSTQFPDANVEMDVAAGKTKRVWDTSFDVRYGRNMKDMDRRISFKQMIRRATNRDGYMLDQNAKLLFKLYGINVATKVSHKHTPTSVKTKAVVNYQPGKEVNLNVDLSRKEDRPIHYNGDISLSYPGRKLRLTDTLQESTGNGYRHQLILQWQERQQVVISTNYKPNGNSHDLRTEVKTPRDFLISNFVLTGNVVLDPKDFKGKTELLYSGDIYAATVDYNIANMAGKGNVDILYPGRHVIVSVTGAKKGKSYEGRLNTRWDADGDKSKKMIMDGRFTTDIDNLEGHIKVSHPSRVLRAMFDHKKTARRYSSHAEVSWERGKKIAVDTDIIKRNIGRSSRFDGTIRFFSPFKNFELLKLHAGHKDDGLSMTSEGDFSWAPQKTVSISNAIKRNRKWTNADIKTTVKTPLEGAEEMQAKTTYKVTSDDITTSFSGQMNKHRIELEGQGKALIYKVKKDIQGSLTVKTTFDRVKDAAIKTNYKYTKQGAEATAEGTLNGKTVSMILKGADRSGSAGRNMMGSLQVTTPFKNYQKMELNTRHTDDGKQFSSQVQGKWQEKEATAALNVNHDGSGLEFKNSGNFELKTPFRSVRNIGASWNAENGNGKATSRLEVEHNQEKMTFDMETRHRSGSFGRRMTTKVMLKPLYYPTRFNTEMSMKHNRKGAEANFMFARDGKRDVDFSAELNKEDKTNFDAKIEMKSNYEKLEDVSALLSLKAAAQPATAHAEIKWTKDDKATIDVDWISISGRSKVDVQVTTPFENFEKTIFNAEHVKTSEKRTVSSQLLYGQRKKLELKSSYGSGKGTFEFSSACPWFKSLTGEVTLRGSLSDFQSNMRVTYEGKQRAFFESSLEHDDTKTSGNMHLQSPSKIFRDVKLTFGNERSSEHKTTMKLDMNNEHSISATSTNKFDHGKYIHSSMVTSTFDSFKKLITKVDHEHNSYGLTTKLSTEADIAGEFTKLETMLEAKKAYSKKSLTASTSFSSSWFQDISGSISGSIDRFNYMSNVEIKYAPAKVINFSGFVSNERNLRGQMKLTTPFEAVPRLESNFQHKGGLKNFKTDAELFYSPWNGKVEGNLAFKLRGNDVYGQINMKSPFRGYERASGELKHTGNRRNQYDTTLLATFGRQRVSIQSDMKVPSWRRIEGTMLATTSFDLLRNMKIAFNHKCDSNSMNTAFEYQRNGRPKTELLVTFNRQNGYQGKATFQSPIKGAQFMELAFNHRGDYYQFMESHAEFSYSKAEKIETDFSYRMTPDFRSSFTFKTPYTQDVEVLVTHSGNRQAFRCHAEYVRDGAKRIQGDLDAVLTRPEMSLRANLKTPFTYFEDITYTTTSTVTEESVRSTSELTYYHGKIVNVANVDIYDGSTKIFTSLNTPYHKEIAGEISYTIRNSRYTGTFIGKYDNEKKIDFSSELMLKPKISGSLSLATAYDMPDIKASFSHAGEATDFKTSGKVILDETKTYSADVSFSYDRALEASVQVTTPEFNTISASLKNQMTKRRLNTDLSLTYDGKKVEVDSNIRFKPNVDISISVKTPFENYKENLLTTKLDFNSNSLSGNARLTQMNSVKFFTELKLNKSPMTLDFSALILDYSPFSLKLKSQGDLSNYRFDGEMNYFKGKMTTTASFKLADNIEGSFEWDTPYQSIGKVSANFYHEGSLSSFSNNAEMNLPNGKFSYNGRFTKEDKVDGNFIIKTPYENLNEVELKFSHEGTWSSFKNMLNIKSPYGRTWYTGSFSKTNRIEGSFQMMSPIEIMKSASLTFNHEGSLSSFSNSAEMSVPTGKFNYNGRFSKGNKVSGNFNIKTPYDKIDEVEVSFDHAGTWTNFRNMLSIKAPCGKTTYTGSFSNNGRIEGSFKLISPVKTYNSISLSFNHEGDYKNFKNSMALTTPQESLGYQGSFSLKPISGDFILTAGFDGVTKKWEAKFGQTGDYRGFAKILTNDEQVISLNGDFQMRPQVVVSLSLETPYPYAEKWTANYNQDIDRNTKTFHADITYLDKAATADVELKGKGLTVSVTTPFEKFESIKYDGKIDGDLEEFSAQHTFNSHLGEIAMSVNFNKWPLEASASLTTPFKHAEDWKAALKYSNDGIRKANAEVSYKSQKVSLGAELAEKNIKLTFTSPFENFKDITYNGGVEGRLKDFTFTSDLNYVHGKIDISGEFDMMPLVAKVKVTTPYDGYDRMAVNLKVNTKQKMGNLAVIIPFGKFRVNGQIKDTSAKLLVQTPFPVLKKLTAEGAFTNDLQTMNFNVKVDRNDEKEAHLEISVASGIKQTMEGKFDSRYTHPVEVKGFLKSAKGEINANAQATYNSDTIFDTSIEANVKSMKDIIVTYKLDTAYTYIKDVQLITEHKIEGYNVLTKIDARFAPGKHIKSSLEYNHGERKEGKVTLETPFEDFSEITVSFSHNGNWKKFEDDATLSFLGKQIVKAHAAFSMATQVNGELTVENPFKNVRLMFNHEGSWKNFENSASLNWGRSIEASSRFNIVGSRASGGFSLTTPYINARQISGSFNHEGNLDRFTNKVELSYAPGKTIKTETKFTDGNKKSGTFTLTTPFSNARTISGSFNHEGSWNSFSNKVELSYAPYKTISTTFTFNNGYKKSATFSLLTPFQQVDRVTGSFEFERRRVDFTTTASITLPRRKVINGKVVFSTGAKTQISATLTSPFQYVEDIGFRMDHKGDLERFENKIQVQISREQTIKAETSFSKTRSISGSFTLKTPFQKIGDMTAMFNHEGTWTSFNNVAEIAVAKRNYKAESKFNHGRSTSGSVLLKSPSNEMSLQFSHEGELKRFSNSATLNLNSKTFSAQSSFTYGYRTQGNIAINSPGRAFGATLDHEGELNQFRTNAEVKYGPSESIRTSVSFLNRQGRTSADFKLYTPFEQVSDVSAGFVHSGNFKRFNTVITVTYAPGKTLQSTTEFSHNTGSTRITYKWSTPFDVIRNLELMANREGSLKNFRVSASASHNERNTFYAEYAHSNTGYSDIKCNTVIRTSLRNLRELSAILNHHHEGYDKIASSIDVAYNSKAVFGASYKHNTDREGAAGSFTLKQPTSFGYEYDIKKTNKELSGKVTINKEYQIIFSNKDTSTYSAKKRIVALKTVLPSRTMSLQGEMESSSTRFVKTGTFSWDADRNRKISYSLIAENNSGRYQKSYSTKARLDTPLRSFETVLTHISDSATYTSTGNFKWDAAKDESKAVTIKNVYQKSDTVCKNELSIRAPGMSQDLIVRGEMAMNHGAMIFMTKGSVDYNRNPSDMLSFNLRLADEVASSAFYNYSLSLDLTHPRSTIAIHGKAHAANDRSKASSGLELSYLTAARKIQKVELMGEIQKLRKQMNIQMKSPVKTLGMTGQVKETRGQYVALATGHVDSQNVKAMFNLDTNKKSLLFKTNYNPENERDEFVIKGQYKSMSEIEAEAFHTSSGRRTTDGELDMDLKNKHLLHTRLYWRPSMYFDIKYGGKKLLKDARTEAVSTWSTLRQHAEQEARWKAELVERAMPSMGDLYEALVEEGRHLVEDAEEVMEAWNRMVQDNEFFLKDIKETTKEAVQYIDIKIRQISGYVMESVARGVVAMSELCQDVMDLLAKVSLACCDYFKDVLQLATRKMILTYNRFAEAVTEASDYAEAVVAKIQASILAAAKKMAAKAKELNTVAMEKMSALWEDAVLRAQPFMDATATLYNNAVQKVTSHPVYLQAQRRVIFYKNKMAAKYNDMRRTLSKIDLTKPVRDLNLNVREKLTKAMASLKKFTLLVSKKFNQAYNMVEDKAEKAVETLIARENFRLVKSIMNEIYHKASWAYEHYQVEKRVKDGVSDALALGFHFVKKNVMYIAIEYLKLDKDRIIVYDPSKAELEFEVYIPLEWPHLQTLPALDMARTLSSVKDKVSKYIPLDYSPWDTYYKYKPSRNPADWIPPFKAVASISGDQHYMTFDKRFFSFAGTCSYVLARDMVDGDFSVVVNYQGNRRTAARRSLTVVSNGKEIEMVKNYKVKVDGKLTNLPIRYLNTTVSRIGDVVRLTNTKGFEVECDFTTDRCTMEISGWYFGKTAGLWGVYNNEPSDDFTTAEHTKVTDAAEFAKSWLVSRSCRINDNVAREVEPQEGNRHTRICADLFRSSSSPYRKCFKQVSPAPFFRMCVNSEERGLCRAASLYVRHCKYEHVPLHMPKKCKRCDSMEQGETKTLRESQVPKSADVVFVVEENSCNQEAGSKLVGLARNIELSLKDKLMKNNRYGLVGFGGKGTEPSLHTIEGEFLADIKDFRGVNVVFEDGSNKDDMSAIEAATKYPFRAGASKIIVLITCGSCNGGRFSQVKDTLTSQGFQLHILRSHDLRMANNVRTPKTSYLFGIDSDTAYTKTTGGRPKGDRELRARLGLPDNKCWELATATRGSYFNVDKLTGGRRAFQKAFMHVLGMRVAKTAPPSTCSTCECVTDELGNTRSVCKPCHSTPVTPLEPSRPHLLGHQGEEPERFRPKPIAAPATFQLDYEESQ